MGVDYRHIISIDPAKRSGPPCIRGLRMTVHDVLEYLASGMTSAQILADFPELNEEDIRACLAASSQSTTRALTPRPGAAASGRAEKVRLMRGAPSAPLH